MAKKVVKKTVKKAAKSSKKAPKKVIKKKPVSKKANKAVKKTPAKRTVKTVKKSTAKKPHGKCVKCGSTKFDIGEIKVGKVFHSHDFGYRSENHNPYADHVGQQHVKVCLTCGFAELYFNIEDLSRKTNK